MYTAPKQSPSTSIDALGRIDAPFERFHDSPSELSPLTEIKPPAAPPRAWWQRLIWTGGQNSAADHCCAQFVPSDGLFPGSAWGQSTSSTRQPQNPRGCAPCAPGGAGLPTDANPPIANLNLGSAPAPIAPSNPAFPVPPMDSQPPTDPWAPQQAPPAANDGSGPAVPPPPFGASASNDGSGAVPQPPPFQAPASADGSGSVALPPPVQPPTSNAGSGSTQPPTWG